MIGRKDFDMRKIDYEALSNQKWSTDILNLVAKIHEHKGRQDLFVGQKTAELSRLIDIAKIQSTEASNKIEGIATSDARVKQLVKEKTTPKNRNEDEIIGYRDVLNTIHESSEYINLKTSHILQLHKDMLKYSDLPYGGKFKVEQNNVTETKPNGEEVIRFVPVAPYETEAAINKICEEYNNAITNGIIDPLILIPIFICDFLCIHPFLDGNGRMSRLLTLLLLYRSGYNVGRYISIEKQIELTKDEYYDALGNSDDGWHEEKNDYKPFIKYMLQIILACYIEFEKRVDVVADDGKKIKAYDIVKKYVEEKLGKFTSEDVITNCPVIGRSSVLSALKKLTEEGIITKHGNGKNTFYVKNK